MSRVDVVVLLVAGLVVFGWFISGHLKNAPQVDRISQRSGTEHFITLTEEGFVPGELSIARGDTVTFATGVGRPFWPASNLHPSHRDYPAFDPKEPIMPEDTWQFTFSEVGTWKYHDHLAPYFTGVIIVLE